MPCQSLSRSVAYREDCGSRPRQNIVLALRILGILAAIAVGVGIVAYIVTGDRKFLRFALELFRWTIILALAFFALIILERVVSSM